MPGKDIASHTTGFAAMSRLAKASISHAVRHFGPLLPVKSGWQSFGGLLTSVLIAVVFVVAQGQRRQPLWNRGRLVEALP